MKVAPPDAIAKAEAERDARLKEKAAIGSLLDEALDDIASLNAILSRQPLFAARLFRVALNLVRRIAPLALAGWVIAQFKHLRGRPTWQELGFAILVLIAYHLIAWISLPFFNAAYRKFLYLNGYTWVRSMTHARKPPRASRSALHRHWKSSMTPQTTCGVRQLATHSRLSSWLEGVGRLDNASDFRSPRSDASATAVPLLNCGYIRP